MVSKGKIKKLFTDSDVEVNLKVDNRIINAALSALGESEKANLTPAEPDVFRKIIKSPIIKLATAALIIITAALAISLWDGPTSTAYAVEQTIEAMRQVTTIHCSMNFFTGDQYELWIEVDPKTGDHKNMFLDSPEVTKVSTPDGTYVYYKDTDEVKYLQESSYLVSKILFGPFIKDMVDLAKSNSNYKINIIEGEGEKSVITVTLEKDESMLEWKIDSETKLPISMSLISKEVLLPLKFNQSINDFSYNVPLPEGIFDYKIPEGTKVKGK